MKYPGILKANLATQTFESNNMDLGLITVKKKSSQNRILDFHELKNRTMGIMRGFTGLWIVQDHRQKH